jgi:lipoprotein-anchoring transpeptidase ErfK/SrfK
MKRLAFVLASGVLALAISATPAFATIETPEAKEAATAAAAIARQDMVEVFGDEELKPGQYLWRQAKASGEPRVVISLGDQMAYVYRGNTLVAAATISTGTEDRVTPKGIFPILEKKRIHHSRKYDNAPMPFMQRIDKYGIALHAGYNPGRPASHGCIRLPAKFAARLYGMTDVGSTVLIGA